MIRILTLRTSKGFTLLEMLVVVAVIALIGVVVVPNVGRIFRTSLKGVVNRLASVVNETYNSTVITGQVHRLVYDLNNREYWVESGPSTMLLDSAESREVAERRRTRTQSEEEEEAKKNQSGFSLEATITRSKTKLPEGTGFISVFTEQYDKPVVQGLAYSHFFPHGLTEQTLIQIGDAPPDDMDEDDRRKWKPKKVFSLVISPLVGKTTVYEKQLDQKDVFQ